jgi:hypothetical protein
MIAGSATRPNRFVAIISLEFTKAPRRSNVGRFYDRSQTQLWRWTGFLPWQEWDSAVERIAYCWPVDRSPKRIISSLSITSPVL